MSETRTRPAVPRSRQPQIVACSVGAMVSITSPIAHHCPFKDEIDEGTVVLAWWTDEGQTIELHSLAAYLAEWRTAELSHEDLTDRIGHDLTALGVEVVSVETIWETAGMEVRCVTSPTRRLQKSVTP